MKTCEICGGRIPEDKRYRHTCSIKCSEIFEYARRKKKARERQQRIRKECIEMGINVKEWRTLRKKEKERKPIEGVRVWYEKRLSVDWSIEELNRIKAVKDRKYV